MDPLSCLSIASSAIQIVEFSARAWSRIKELSESQTGASSEHESLRKESQRLHDLNSHLAKLLAPENLRRDLTSTEQAVVSLSADCDSAAEHLAQALQKLSIGGDDEGTSSFSGRDIEGSEDGVTIDRGHLQRKRKRPIERSWNAVRATVREVWMRKDIDSLCRKVEDLKRSLAMAILANIQHEVISSSRKLNELTSRAAKWDTAKPCGDWILSRNPDSHLWQTNVLNVVGAREPGGVGLSVDAFSGLLSGHPRIQPWSAVSNRIIDRLLTRLSFDEMFGRQERIPDNFQGTFQWIYSEPQDPDRPWDSFSSWLTQGRGVYWIAGKAGSGKSTLMRMLLYNPRTTEHLHRWSKGGSLITATFFFWNSGSKLQMSHDGLLRSLLQQAIEQRLKQASERLARKLETFHLTIRDDDKIYIRDLEQLFRLLIEEDDEAFKYFFLIDGLDEIEGDKSALVSFVHTLGAYPNVKICVSSRPWVVFEDGFGQEPSLMLQFLTFNDIALYVREKLAMQPAFRELAWGYPENSEELVNEVTAKASGVFLWVILAVESLIRGLADGDRIEDLRRRLDELPEKLEELFQRMLHGLEGRYFTDAARLFRIHRASKEPQFGFSRGLSLLALAFAEESTFDSATKRPVKPLTAKEMLMHSVTMKRRLSSRCNGLLEIEDPRRKSGDIWNARNLDRLITDAGVGDPSVLPTLYSYGSALAKTTVQYLHRTVKDFLESPEVWEIIEQAATGNRPCPRTSLCLARVLFWKTCELNNSSAGPQSKEFKSRLEQCFMSALPLTTVHNRLHIQVLDTIAEAMFQEDSATLVWNRLNIARPPEDFLSLCVDCGLFDYVQARLTQLQPRVSVAWRSRLLQVAVSKKKPMLYYPGFPRAFPVLPAKKKPMPSLHGGTLHGYGADSECVTPNNDEDSERSMILDEVDRTRHRDAGASDVDMVKLLIDHGADPDLVIDGITSRQIVMKRVHDFEEQKRHPDYVNRTFDQMLSCFEDRSGKKIISRDLAGKAKRLFN